MNIISINCLNNVIDERDNNNDKNKIIKVYMKIIFTIVVT